MNNMSGAEIVPSALYKLSYGLFVLTARSGGKDNGCIINTAVQVADAPKRIHISVIKKNFTHDMIAATGEFNLSVLTEATPFSEFERFGFRSGRDTDKFAGFPEPPRSSNGIFYLPEYANALISGRVISSTDLGTHTSFFADVTEAAPLSDAPPATYAFYFSNIKPKPAIPKVKGFVCKICGYIYEGDTLPPDLICPLCNHGAEDFEPIF